MMALTTTWPRPEFIALRRTERTTLASSLRTYTEVAGEERGDVDDHVDLVGAAGDRLLGATTLAFSVSAPKGNEMTEHTLTSAVRSSSAASGTKCGKMQTAAKWYLAASRQRRSTSGVVVSAFSSVWSMVLASSSACTPLITPPGR